MSAAKPTLLLDFAGEEYEIEAGTVFTVGRRGDLVIDDNPYLHRDLLAISYEAGFWWVHNTGSRIPVRLTDHLGLMRATLAPGARTPLVFEKTLVVFDADSTTYEIRLSTKVSEVTFAPSQTAAGETTMGAVDFTESQLLVILALAEPTLRNPGSGGEVLPTSVEAAKRLGWRLTKFNRKLDNVCEKLERVGVSGLRGTARSGAAANRRLRLVEYASSTLLVTVDDLPLLDAEAEHNRQARAATARGNA